MLYLEPMEKIHKVQSENIPIKKKKKKKGGAKKEGAKHFTHSFLQKTVPFTSYHSLLLPCFLGELCVFAFK